MEVIQDKPHLPAQSLMTICRMATSSTPGGSIPNFIAQASVPGQVANDVPLFFKWLQSDREYFKKRIAEDEHAQSAAPADSAPSA